MCRGFHFWSGEECIACFSRLIAIDLLCNDNIAYVYILETTSDSHKKCHMRLEITDSSLSFKSSLCVTRTNLSDFHIPSTAFTGKEATPVDTAFRMRFGMGMKQMGTYLLALNRQSCNDNSSQRLLRSAIQNILSFLLSN